MRRSVDAVVVGGGHAGIEAAWALGRLGHRVALVTFDAGALGRMSCNPSVGGLAKGQLVREVDALGGLIGRLIDRTGIHFRMLNRKKGPAVRAPRAQADGAAYSREALRVLSRIENLVILEAEVTDIRTETGPRQEGRACEKGSRNGPVLGVRLTPPRWSMIEPGGPHSEGAALPRTLTTAQRDPDIRRVVRISEPTELSTNVVVLTVGTFLQGKIFTGLDAQPGGRRGEPPAVGLSASLQRLGLQLGRLKTGTPPRLWKESIDFSRATVQPGDEPPPRFSFSNEATVRNRAVCHFTRTNERTHEIIAGSLDRSPLYGGGLIRGIGPRYCPSIEDKVVRFPERRSHQIFLEPEGLDSDVIYPAGIATSLPEDVQLAYVRTIPGLEQATFVHPGYAVEYDFLLTSQIDSTLGVRGIEGLFAAGQINGTSGYEEAAAQGIIAGLNAHALLAGREPIVLARDQAYIGVLIDDLVTKVPTEPYRMFTSQSEYRLLLRQDNADRRLSHLGRQIGLLGRADWVRAERRWARIEEERQQLGSHRLNREQLRRLWKAPDSSSLGDRDLGKTLEDLLKQPRVTMETLKALGHCTDLSELDEATIEAEVKYSGYIRKQEREVARTRALENLRIPERILDAPPAALSTEALERLKEHRPRTLGQALRIPGVTPSDVFLLAVRIRSRSGASAKTSRCTGESGRKTQGVSNTLPLTTLERIKP